jgi:hypothetical protein
MDYYTKKDTLLEGRNALRELEKQLKLNKRSPSAPPSRLKSSAAVKNAKTASNNYDDDVIYRRDVVKNSSSGNRYDASLENDMINDYYYKSSNNSSNRIVSNIDRRQLDQIPRRTRLDYRKGSPLGLTLEELDDRGLLVEGGSVVPSYYTSLKQKNRRQQELKRRTSRLADREKHVHFFTSYFFTYYLFIISYEKIYITYYRYRRQGS